MSKDKQDLENKKFCRILNILIFRLNNLELYETFMQVNIIRIYRSYTE